MSYMEISNLEKSFDKNEVLKTFRSRSNRANL